MPISCSFNSPDKNIEMKKNYMNRLHNYKNIQSVTEIIRIDINLIEESICNLKLGKAVGIDMISVEHLKYSHPLVTSILTKLLNLFILFSHVPLAFGFGITTSLLENKTHKNSVTTVDFRGIT